MALLWRISDEAMDPGYAAAAHGRGSSAVRPWGAVGRSFTVAAALLVVGALGTAALLQAHLGAPDAARTRADLVSRVQSSTVETDELARHVDSLNAATTQLRSQSLTGSESDVRLAVRVGEYERAVGLEGVRGPGVKVVLEDGPPDQPEEGVPDLARVLDQDLQLAANGLFAAGAEAISINGQRLTSLSAIRGAGDAILVDYRPLTPPYVVSAIGDPSTMTASFAGGAAAAQLKTLANTYGIGFDLQRDDDLTLPGDPDVTLRYAQRRAAR